jgi:Uma2 family endonuclease
MVLGRVEDMTAGDPAQPLLVRLPARPLTLDDVAELAALDDIHRYELDEGNLVVMAPADTDHAELVTRILVWLVAHGYATNRVLATPGVQIKDKSSGRLPDLMLLSRPVPATVWVDPADVLLVVEVVSKSSERLDRDIKPGEYARAGIRQYWRVERDGAPTAHMYRIGTDEQGKPAYVDHEVVLLDKLLDGEPPRLS